VALRRLALALVVAAVLVLVTAPSAGAYIFWTNLDTNTIGRAYLDGTGVNQSFIGGASLPEGAAVNDDFVYWPNSGAPESIGRATVEGAGVNQSFIPGARSPDGVAVNSTHIYWANFGAPQAIGRANLNGTGPNQSFITGAMGPEGMALDSAHVYWANFGNSRIGRADLDGMNPNQSFAGSPDPRSVAVDGSHIYWGNYTQGTIGRSNLDGVTGVNPSFISGADHPRDVEVGGGYIYWTNSTSNTIGRAKLDGTGVKQNFISGAHTPWGIAVSPDTTPPNTSIATGPSSTVRSTSANFSFGSSETRSTFECRLDSAASFTACGATNVFSGLANGGHVLLVRARDHAGNPDPTPTSRGWIVDTIASVLNRYRLSPKTFRAARRGGSVRAARRRHKVGTTVRFRLSEAATVRFRVERRNAGRRVRGKCRKRTRRNRRARKCNLRLKGSFKWAGKAGSNRFRFTGRLRGRKLKPGRYYLVARSTDSVGNRSKAKRVKFRIVRR
jgi:virginiamycin B lyase